MTLVNKKYEPQVLNYIMCVLGTRAICTEKELKAEVRKYYDFKDANIDHEIQQLVISGWVVSKFKYFRCIGTNVFYTLTNRGRDAYSSVYTHKKLVKWD